MCIRDSLDEADLVRLLDRALTDPRGLADAHIVVEPEVLARIARAAAGDARRALDDLERCVGAAEGGTVDLALVDRVLQRADIRHDRAGDDHFNVVSALIK